MMRFKDFPIKILQKEDWMNFAKFEKVDETLLRINNWVEENEHGVLNIETLFFPELDQSRYGTGAATFKDAAAQGMGTDFFQVFRVWYTESIQTPSYR